VETINLGYVFDQETPTENVILEITPRGALSLVTTPSGNHYVTSKKPTFNMLCGLIENILGIHIGRKEREDILTKLFSVKAKDLKKYQSYASEKAYLPLIFNQVKVKNILIPNYEIFVDTSMEHWSRPKSSSHYSGCKNNDYELENLKWDIKVEDKVDDIIMDKLPTYYSTPKKREYILYKGKIICDLLLSPSLLNDLKIALEDRSCAYLGTSDGIVDLKITIL
jgi:CRISPR-associated protein Cas5